MALKEYVTFRALKLRDYQFLKEKGFGDIVARVEDNQAWTERALNGDGLYQMPEFKAKVNLSARTITRYINKGVISPLKLGASYIFTDFDILDIIEAHLKRNKGGRPSKAQKIEEEEALAKLEANIEAYNKTKGKEPQVITITKKTHIIK